MSKVKSSTIEPGVVNLILSKDDFKTLVSLLQATSKAFEVLAASAAHQSDEASYKVLMARHQLANYFTSKLVEFNMPEPTSKLLH